MAEGEIMNSKIATAALVTLCLLTGCASVKVDKVGDPAAPAGLRFYLPRPYVSVYEPFVIDSEVYIVGGTVSPDGNYLLLDNVEGDLGGHLRVKDGSVRIETSKIRVLGNTGGEGDEVIRGTQQGSEVTDDDGTEAPAEQPEDKGTKAKDGAASGGITDTKMVNDNSFAVTPGRRFFDILWLPDFDEQYVIKTKSGLGNASVDLTMGQAWSLQGIESRVDNSALAAPLLDLYGKSMNLLFDVAKASVGIPSVVSGAQQGAAVTANDVFTGGTPLTVKVTIVEVVAPGLYPVLKPKELNAENAAELRKSVHKWLHVPTPPLTNVAFNTYEVIVIEAAKPAGDSPMNLQGYFDYADSRSSEPYPDSGSNAQTPITIKDQVNAFLVNRKSEDNAHWELTKLEQVATGWTATVALVGGTIPPMDEATLKKAIANRSGGKIQDATLQLVKQP